MEELRLTGSREELVDGVQQFAPGMHRSTAEEIVDDHLDSGLTEIILQKEIIATGTDDQYLQGVVSAYRNIEESFGKKFYVDRDFC